MQGLPLAVAPPTIDEGRQPITYKDPTVRTRCGGEFVEEMMGTAGTKIADGAGFVYGKSKVAAQAVVDKTKQIAVRSLDRKQ